MDESNAVFYLWQYEHGTRWITYSEQKLQVINNAYNKGKKTVTVPDKDAKKHLLLNFDKMFQKNKASGWEQRIRCCVFDESFYTWQWKDDDDDWVCYSPAVSVELEICFKLEKVAKFFNKKDYEVDFTSFKQKNEETGNLRDVRREKVEIEIKAPALKQIALAFTTYVKAACENNLTAAANTQSENGPKTKKLKVEKQDKQVEDSTVTYVMRGKVPVDPECLELAGIAHVYSEGSVTYDAMLNLANLSANNNKFYRLQLLKHDSYQQYFVWFHWGRVGAKGQKNLIPYGKSLYDAKETFTTKFRQKTLNDWEEKCFTKHKGKYDLVKVDYGSEDIPKKKTPEDEMPEESPLHPKVRNILKLISSVDEITKTIVEMNFDVKKAPLGKLSKEQIKAGYLALKKIESILKKGELGAKLLDANNEFYTCIPHNFGMKVPPIIRSSEAITEKLDLLEALSNIELAVEIQKDSGVENSLVYLYNTIRCDMKVLAAECEMYRIIKKYLTSTRGPTHKDYQMKILDIYEVYKDQEHKDFVDYGNKVLLWHGSRLTNFVGILKCGLLIAPPEAPSTGYMFGKGLYFADISTKSANYCHATKQSNEGLLLLCEVSLGEENIKFKADYNADVDTKERNKHCVKALGKFEPDPTKKMQKSDVDIPLGKPCLSKYDAEKCELLYNEYIIYDTKQVKMKYLVHVEFLF